MFLDISSTVFAILFSCKIVSELSSIRPVDSGNNKVRGKISSTLILKDLGTAKSPIEAIKIS